MPSKSQRGRGTKSKITKQYYKNKMNTKTEIIFEKLLTLKLNTQSEGIECESLRNAWGGSNIKWKFSNNMEYIYKKCSYYTV